MRMLSRLIICLLATAILMLKCSSSDVAIAYVPSQNFNVQDDIPGSNRALRTQHIAKEDSLRESCMVAKDVDPVLNVMPILMYDSNIGVGYGAKLFLLNQLHHTESFDLTLFSSTKGERWYRFVGSWPDSELRQGKIYPIAADLTIEYDKLIKASFFGIGNGSRSSKGFAQLVTLAHLTPSSRMLWERSGFGVTLCLASWLDGPPLGPAIHGGFRRNMRFADPYHIHTGGLP